jgi:hypothetical protein
MGKLIALGGCIAVAFALFYLSARTPDPVPASAPPGVFSAGRAMRDIAAMAPVPHPIGSPANHAVRDYLIGRMASLGLTPRIQRDESHAGRVFGGEYYVSGADVENVIGVLPGADRAAPALVLMAHYDSVPGSPGAADDITSVAAVLEIVRAIETGPKPARDVLVVFTDGEEAGLLGAHAFFADDPLSRRAGFLLNLEARGGGGRAVMFETGADNGGGIGLYRDTAKRPLANSLTAFVYKLLPNDTDFTVARRYGVAGLNYAFIGRQFDYHSPSSTVAALDQGSVQHIGDEVLPTARALALAPVLPARARDAVYGNLVGDWLIAYPTWAGWVLLAAAGVVLVFAARRSRNDAARPWFNAWDGLGVSAFFLIGAALLLDLARTATGVAAGWIEYRPLLARFPLFEASMALVATASLILIAAAISRWRERRLAIAWTGLLATGFAVALGLQLLVPTTAFFVAWPVNAGAVCAALTAGGAAKRPFGWATSLAITALTLAWLGGLYHALMQGLDRAEAGAVIVWLAAMVAFPLVFPAENERRGALVVGGVLLAAGFAGALWLNLTSPWTPRHPRAAEPLFVVEADTGKAWRATPLALDSWTRGVLTADGGRIGRRAFAGFAKPLAAAPARRTAETAPPVTVTRSAAGIISVAAPMPDGASLALDLRSDVPVAVASLQGKPTTTLLRPRKWTHVRWQASPEGLRLAFKPRSAGTLDVRWALSFDRWPADASPPPKPPADVMGWDRAGSTVFVGRLRRTWTN